MLYPKPQNYEISLLKWKRKKTASLSFRVKQKNKIYYFEKINTPNTYSGNTENNVVVLFEKASLQKHRSQHDKIFKKINL